MTATEISAAPIGGEAQTGTEAPARMSTLTRLWAWGWIASFVIHDGEEAGYIVKHGGLKEFGTFQSTAQCLSGMLFELTVGWLAILAATRSARPGWPMRLFGVLLFGWTLHGVLHLIEGAATDGYAFGEATALPVVVIYGIFALGRLYREHLLERRWLVPTALAGAVVGFALVYIAHGYGSLMG